MIKSKSAFTLLETMVAVIVLVALVIGGSAVLSQTGRAIAIQGHKRTAVEIASGILEIERSKAYAAIVAPSSDSFVRTVGGKDYPVSVVWTEEGDNAGNDAKSVSIRVTYQNGESVSFKFSRTLY